MFLTTIAWGANLFITIVVLLIALGTGITITDFLKSNEDSKDISEPNPPED